jgi:hypothetical protein
MTLADKLAEAHERLDALRRRVEKAEQQRDALRAEVQRVTGQFAECFKERDELAAALRRVQQWFKYPKMDDRPTEVIKAALKRVEEGRPCPSRGCAVTKREEARECGRCHGTGDHPYSWYDPDAVCTACGGRGWVIVVVDEAGGTP